jgi:hypothetical protein
MIALEAHLDLPGAILQFDKAGLAHDALDHHSPNDGDLDFLGTQRFVIVVRERRQQLVGRRIAPKIIRKRVAVGALGIEFAAALGKRLAFVLWRVVGLAITVLA